MVSEASLTVTLHEACALVWVFAVGGTVGQCLREQGEAVNSIAVLGLSNGSTAHG